MADLAPTSSLASDESISYTLRKVCQVEDSFIAEMDFIFESKRRPTVESMGERRRFEKRPFSVRAPSNKPLQQSGSPQ